MWTACSFVELFMRPEVYWIFQELIDFNSLRDENKGMKNFPGI